jgi:hypothetical protein
MISHVARVSIATRIADRTAAKVDEHTAPGDLTVGALLCRCGRSFARMAGYRQHWAATREANSIIWDAAYVAALDALTDAAV